MKNDRVHAFYVAMTKALDAAEAGLPDAEKKYLAEADRIKIEIEADKLWQSK